MTELFEVAEPFTSACPIVVYQLCGDELCQSSGESDSAWIEGSTFVYRTDLVFSDTVYIVAATESERAKGIKVVFDIY